MKTKKILLFGAGKIGRSFIGQVFGMAGYELIFVDINPWIVDLLNKEKSYTVVIKSDNGEERLSIKNVRALNLENTEEITHELAEADLACVSVGQQGLPGVIPLLADGLKKRWAAHGIYPLDIIIAENMRNTDKYIMGNITPLLPHDFPLSDMLGLVETSIGKMVPIMTSNDLKQDPLQVFAEPYNTLIVSEKGFKNPIPDIPELAPKKNIKAWVDRKLFIHNLGHSAMAYYGFAKNPHYTFIHEAANDTEIYSLTRGSMLQSAEILLSLFPGEFSKGQLVAHVDNLLHRFKNQALGDTIFRVGCDLYRKLSADDRLAAPIRASLERDLPCDLIVNALKAAMQFRAKDEQGNYLTNDIAFFEEAQKGIWHVFEHVSGFKKEPLERLKFLFPML